MMENINRIEIIKKDDNVIQLRIQDGDSVSSYIISPDEIEKAWIDNIFSMSVSMRQNAEKK
ncbi:MAG: hypothetical protein SLAVMIC_00826 [uncultured marine phage]|uniref:Uncharacterized protein n=1 Tax=uncultured marine phage TaxID=707152 RepID=A0A8D9CCS2_9VIRU|nr:MAG: hypothetical protein SLAVMIC_00826 [uncultured marine phage]